MSSTSTAALDLYFTSHLERGHAIQEYKLVRGFSEQLCQPLEVEDYIVQSMEDASPTRWHLAHTSWFFETFVLLRFLEGYTSEHPEYAYLFNSYYLQAGDRYPRPQRGLITRPTVAEVFGYRRSIDAAMIDLMESTFSEDWRQVAPIVEIGLHHEQQHQELMLTDLKHAFFQNPLFPAYQQVATSHASATVSALEWRSFEEGIHQLGHDGDGFCFDNETPSHRRLVGAFELANRLITNGEYQEFIEDGGYHTETLWLSDALPVVSGQNWEAPLYWIRRDGEWWNYTLRGLEPVESSLPVCHVSYYEADAFARWADARLPLEAEWEVAVQGLPIQGNFADRGLFHPAAPGESDDPLRQIYGDVWEWTCSPYVGYPGYRPDRGALGEYNGKFMANQMVLKGGSCATSMTHIRPTYRNFFHPPKRWQFSGIRLARDIQSVST